ncbi:MAG: hypothetical protein IJI47_03445 [Eubacterium sp.]|nr:hypothetical protein [Eubacterium sp.]
MKFGKLAKQCRICFNCVVKKADGNNTDFVCRSKPSGLMDAREELCDYWFPQYGLPDTTKCKQEL